MTQGGRRNTTLAYGRQPGRSSRRWALLAVLAGTLVAASALVWLPGPLHEWLFWRGRSLHPATRAVTLETVRQVAMALEYYYRHNRVFPSGTNQQIIATMQRRDATGTSVLGVEWWIQPQPGAKPLFNRKGEVIDQ